MKLVVAVDNEWGIGYKGDLLARIRADLQNFRRLTEGKTVVLGSNTLATFPGGKALKNRTNIVLHPDASYAPDNALVAHSIDELLEMIKDYNTDDVFVIGGASVYRQLLPYCDTAYVTKFLKSYDKDVWLENLDASAEWLLADESAEFVAAPEDTDPDLKFVFCTYKRVLPPLLIREAKRSDAQEIYGLLKVIADHHRKIRPDLMGDTVSKYDLPTVCEHIGDGVNFIFVAERDNNFCGYIMCRFEYEFAKTLYVDDLCVKSEYRRQGIAKKLMQYAERFGKENGCAYLLLNVWSGNDAAIEFYNNCGLKERSIHLDKKL